MNEMPTFVLPKTPSRIWDLDVPVVIDNDTITAYITGPVAEPSNYNELCYLLAHASSSTTVTLHINTPGGIIDSAFMIVSAIKQSEAKVIGVLSGTVASAGTLIAMACHEIVATDHLSFMIHNYSGGMAGKGHEMKARQKFTDKHLNEAFKAFYSGFLTIDEMERVIEGTDFWMGSEEVRQRWSERQGALELRLSSVA
jgi:ATP-dependent protease ClpP protease subunit